MIVPPEQVDDSRTPRLLLRLWRHFNPRRKRQFILVTLVMIVSAVAEMATLGAVLPFITVLVEPERALRYGFVADLAQLVGVDQAEDLVFPLALVFVVGAVFAAMIRVVVIWLTSRVAVVAGSDLGAQAYERTLYQSYATHVDRNTSDVTSGLLHKVEAVVSGMLLPIQLVVGSLFTIVTVTLALFLIDPAVAAVAILIFGSGYIAITSAFRGRLKRNSQRVARESTLMVKAIQEGIGGIRDILIDGTQAVFLDQFRRSDRQLRSTIGSNNVIQQAPRAVMEGLGMVLIAMLAMALNGRPDGITNQLPVLGALVLGGQRLLPIYQQCYYAVTAILGNRAAIGEVLDMLDQPMPPTYGLPPPAPLDLQTGISCEQLRFRYDEKGPWVLDGLDLTIDKGTWVGLVGTTGSGKSTLLDLLMGLLVPVEGAVLVDGQVPNGSYLRAWQQSIAHVPQHIFLADVSIAENIAFGAPADSLDMDCVREAARSAHIAEFIEDQPSGYATVTGERGIRISGGQRQRIGIARALYKQASVLILDEATNALDSQTEQSVIRSLAAPDSEFTVILVSHRLTTLKNCDLIIELSDGRIGRQGTFLDLVETSPTLQKMALDPEGS